MHKRRRSVVSVVVVFVLIIVALALWPQESAVIAPGAAVPLVNE
jgi:hypothetical protein